MSFGCTNVNPFFLFCINRKIMNERKIKIKKKMISTKSLVDIMIELNILTKSHHHTIHFKAFWSWSHVPC